MAIASPKSYDTELAELLRKVDNGELQLPDFQRSWTWDRQRISNLIASVSRGFPMGALMHLERGGADAMGFRPFEGTTRASREPTHLVLDGQQRLTSLYRSLMAKEPVTFEEGKPCYFYLDMRKCLDQQFDREEAIVTVDDDKKQKTDFNRRDILDLSTTELEVEHLMYPANLIFDQEGADEWFTHFISRYGIESKEYREEWPQFRDEVIYTIKNYKVPVITLPRESTPEAVCKVFENVNTGGVSLTVFELVTARFAADGFRLREDWEDARRFIVEGPKGKIVTDLMEDVGDSTYLMAMTLLSSYRRRRDVGSGITTCKRRDVLNLPLDDYQANREDLLEGFDMARDFLVGENVFRKIDLPYGGQLVPLAAILAEVGRKRFSDPRAKATLRRWYWCGVLGRMYGGSNETRYANDMEDVVAAMLEGSGAIHTIDDAYFQTSRLLQLRTRNSADYKGVMALVLKAGAEDFIDGERMSVAKADVTPPDIHHIFPRRYCEREGLSKSIWDSVVNKTPLISTTNRTLGGVAPSSYIGRIERKAGIGRDTIAKRIGSHLIDFDLLAADDFDGFVLERARALLDVIEEAMGKEIQDRASDEVRERFGATLETRR